MNPKLIEACTRALAEDSRHMDMESREKLVSLIPILSQLYRDDSTRRGVLIVASEEGQTVYHINADQYEAYGMIHEALPMHDHLLRSGMPDQGSLN